MFVCESERVSECYCCVSVSISFIISMFLRVYWSTVEYRAFGIEFKTKKKQIGILCMVFGGYLKSVVVVFFRYYYRARNVRKLHILHTTFVYDVSFCISQVIADGCAGVCACVRASAYESLTYTQHYSVYQQQCMWRSPVCTITFRSFFFFQFVCFC